MTLRPPELNRIIDTRRAAVPMPVLRDRPALLAGGEAQRLRRGIYTPRRPELRTLPWEQRAEAARQAYLDEIAAVGLTRRGEVVFSHRSAAAILGLPVLGGRSTAVDILEARESARRSKRGVQVHRLPFDAEELVRWGEFWVTGVARTVADLARDSTTVHAVTALDAVLRRGAATKEEVAAVLDRTGVVRGAVRARAALDLADARAASPGESVSRVLMHGFGCPAPELQLHHASSLSFARWFETDFEWPGLRKIGEFDGAGKYLKPEYLRGREPGEVVYEEKRREDALRAEGNAVERWGWAELRTPTLLRDVLVRLGVPMSRAARGIHPLW